MKLNIEVDTQKPKDVEDTINMLETFSNTGGQEYGNLDELSDDDSEVEEGDDLSDEETVDEEIEEEDKEKKKPGRPKKKVGTETEPQENSKEVSDTTPIPEELPNLEKGVLVEEEDEY